MSIISSLTNCIINIAHNILQKKNRISYQIGTEIETGDKWIDGKKIYTIIDWWKTSSQINTIFNLTKPNNCDFIISVHGFTDETNTKDYTKIGRIIPYTLGMNNSAIIEVSIGNSFYERHSQAWSNNIWLLLILTYTKIN